MFVVAHLLATACARLVCRVMTVLWYRAAGDDKGMKFMCIYIVYHTIASVGSAALAIR